MHFICCKFILTLHFNMLQKDPHRLLVSTQWVPKDTIWYIIVPQGAIEQ